jgi:2,3-bisphosphoglycerate-independent phosphoglycerate mutase
MKYCVLIMDGAAGYALADKGHKTTLELANTPNLDRLAREGTLGMTLNVPEGMEPSSAIACMSLMGYDPKKYYSGRAPIEARSMDIALNDNDAVFRCNLVTLKDGVMKSYCSGHITDAESHEIIATLNEKIGNDRIKFYPGVSYRHLVVIKDGLELLKAECTPPHDISDKFVAEYRPKGAGALFLSNLMAKSEEILRVHPVNKRRVSENQLPATSVWLFWGGKRTANLPLFSEVYRKRAAMSSGVDLLRGISAMAGIDILNIPGVTGGLDTDYAAQIDGALAALEKYDVVIVHVESPDEAGHMGSYEEKIKAIEMIDSQMVGKMAACRAQDLRLLILPDHPTPIPVKTHTPGPVPFILWGAGIENNSGEAYSEKEAASTGFFVNQGHSLMSKLLYS